LLLLRLRFEDCSVEAIVGSLLEEAAALVSELVAAVDETVGTVGELLLLASASLMLSGSFKKGLGAGG
jgi:hypothetical protein